MRIKPINPYAKLLQDRKYKPQVTKNKKKYDRNKRGINIQFTPGNFSLGTAPEYEPQLVVESEI